MKKEDRDHAKPTTKNAQTGSSKTRQHRRAGESKTTFTPPISGLRLTDRWGTGNNFNHDQFREDTRMLHVAESNGAELVRDLAGNLFFSFVKFKGDVSEGVYIYESGFDAARRWLEEELRGTDTTSENFLQMHGIRPPASVGIQAVEYIDLEKAIYEAQGLLDLLTQKLYADFLFKKSEEGLFSREADRAINGCMEMVRGVNVRLEAGLQKLLDSVTTTRAGQTA